MQFIDAHHHLWDVELNGANYPWYIQDHGDRGWGDTAAIMRNYTPADLLADARDADLTIVKSVHVQANFDFSNPIGETRWLDAVAGEVGSENLPTAIVGYADLSAPDVADVLAAHAESGRFRGVRQVLNRHDDPKLNRAPQDYLVDPNWAVGLRRLCDMGLSFDAQIYHHQAEALTGIAKSLPDLPVVIDHALMPAERDETSIESWRRAVTRLAELPNVSMKISGFGMVDNNWTIDSIRPFALHCIEAFGSARIMFGSNFPVDKLMSDYGRLWRAYDEVISGFSEDERRDMLIGTAERFYRI
ncbi:amidohydrolase family protein [Ruegeria pomeroyi]|nr:amidohydrolase family protein [Ruegeria pomeroyi]MCE8531986.1 amidohydrolase family protein [Ruegeria pomeroyi]